jgi:hypothetical protein
MFVTYYRLRDRDPARAARRKPRRRTWRIARRSRLVVMTEWAWTSLTLQRRAPLITGDRMSPGV